MCSVTLLKRLHLIIPRLLHPSLQANVPTGLFDLHGGRVGLFSAQSFGEVSGVFGRKAAGGRKTGRTLGVAQGVALWRGEEGWVF